MDLCAGLPCEDHSLCNGRNKLCIARGPAWPDNFRSNEIIAQRQADRALELLTSATEEVSGMRCGSQPFAWYLLLIVGPCALFKDTRELEKTVTHSALVICFVLVVCFVGIAVASAGGCYRNGFPSNMSDVFYGHSL